MTHATIPSSRISFFYRERLPVLPTTMLRCRRRFNIAPSSYFDGIRRNGPLLSAPPGFPISGATPSPTLQPKPLLGQDQGPARLLGHREATGLCPSTGFTFGR